MDYCIICEHPEDMHNMLSGWYDGLVYCNRCLTIFLDTENKIKHFNNKRIPNTHPLYHRFNDNLEYIVRLAKERGLV
jgi:hypothetical protein